MKNPLISVIVPNYNHAPYLLERIESILSQSFQDFELILLDDFSTDQSTEVLKKYQNHEKVSHLLLNEKNSGSTFKQWNKGISLAKGKYIWLAESDDYADPLFLENLTNILLADSKIGIVFCQSYIVDSQSVIQNEYEYIGSGKALLKENYPISGEIFTKKYQLIWNHIPNASAVLFEKELYKAIKIEIEGFKLYGDWLFWLEMMQNTNIYFLEKSLNYFRKHSQNVRTKTEKIGKDVAEFTKLVCLMPQIIKIESYTHKKQIFLLLLIWKKSFRWLDFKKNYQILSQIYPIDSKIFYKLWKTMKPAHFPPKNWRDLKILLGETLFPNLYQFFKNIFIKKA